MVKLGGFDYISYVHICQQWNVGPREIPEPFPHFRQDAVNGEDGNELDAVQVERRLPYSMFSPKTLSSSCGLFRLFLAPSHITRRSYVPSR